MAWFLFIDDDGNQKSSVPYSMLSGLLVEDFRVWGLVQKIKEAQTLYLSSLVPGGVDGDLKAEALLNFQVFRDAGHPTDAAAVGSSADLGDAVQHRIQSDFTSTEAAAASAKILYCEYILSLALKFEASAIAIFSTRSPAADRIEDRLEHGYICLLERFSQFLLGVDDRSIGILAFPRSNYEVGVTRAKVLQAHLMQTVPGRGKSQRIIPEPAYVDVCLGAVSHLVETFSYVVGWGTRLPGMSEYRRPELSSLLKHCSALRFSYSTDSGHKDWSFKFISDPQPSTPPEGRARPINRQSLAGLSSGKSRSGA